MGIFFHSLRYFLWASFICSSLWVLAEGALEEGGGEGVLIEEKGSEEDGDFSIDDFLLELDREKVPESSPSFKGEAFKEEPSKLPEIHVGVPQPGFGMPALPKLPEYYTGPGIIAFKEGKWVGSDHLYNLSRELFLSVEIVKPENANIDLSEVDIRNRIATILRLGKLIIAQHPDMHGVPLPMYHMLIMVYPIDRGFVAYCDGRLFESVKLQRVILDRSTTMQAITWEKQSLILAPEQDFMEQLNKTIDEITSQFVARYQYYESIKQKNGRK